MAVRIKFDNTHNVIQPTFVLATRAGHKLGSIPATNISVSDSFNSSFELEFKVNQSNNGKKYHLWDKITDFKLVWCKEWDVWFEMHVSVQEENDTVKNVSCISLGEAELSQINLYNIEINTENDIARDDYSPTVLYKEDNTNASLLHRIMDKVPHYSIRHVDASIANIQRTFTFDNISLYDAFQKIAEEIRCIFVIDSGTDEDGSISRSVSVYDLETYCEECGNRDNFSGKCPKCGSQNVKTGYGEGTTIFVSKENLADNITLSTDIDSVKNCFRLEAGDELMTSTIRSCNPNGSQYIWYISDETKNDMSEELTGKLAEYDETYEYYYERHNTSFTGISEIIVNEYNNLVAKYRTYNKDLNTIPNAIVGYPALMNAYYDTIDLYLLLHDGLMPSPELSRTTAALEAAKLGSNTLSPVAVQDLSKCSTSTVSSTVLSVAKTIVDPRYQVKVNNGVLNGNKWVGNFTVTNYSDDTDTADSSMSTVTINDDYETFVKQKLDKVLNTAQDKEESANDISSLFKLPLDSFKEEIKKYCLISLNSFCDACQSCLDLLIEQGIADRKTWADKDPDLYTVLYLDYYNKLMALQDEVKLRESEIGIVVGTYDADGVLKTDGVQTLIEKERTSIQNALDMEQYLGNDLWLEFISYRREDTYSNDNYISDGLDNGELFKRALEFIDVAKKEIYKSSTLQHSLSASLKNLLVMKEFAPIVDNFSVGNWIRVKIDDNIYRLRLLSYSIDFDDLNNMSVTFSDVTKFKDGCSDVESVLENASSMSTSYSYVSRQASEGSNSMKIVDNWVKDGLDLTNQKIMSNASGQTQTWDSHGMLFRKLSDITDEYEDTQMKIINSTIAITDDGWETVKTALGEYYYKDPKTGEYVKAYGLIAETIVGELICGEKLVLSGDGSVLDISSNETVKTIQGSVGSLSETVTNNHTEFTQTAKDISAEVATVKTYATSHYGTCSTNAETAEKAVSCQGFELYEGAIVQVYFSCTNKVDNPTLNVNSTGAKQILAYDSALTVGSEYNWSAKSTVTFIYTGSFWRIADSGTYAKLALAINDDGIATLSAHADSIEFSSNEISISSDNFSLTKAGVITATSGKIAGWSIDSSMIQKSIEVETSYYPVTYAMSLNAPESPTPSTIAMGIKRRFYAGDHWTDSNDFYVRYDGYLYASAGKFGGSCEFAGTLSAAKGTFAGDISAATGTFTGSIDIASDTCAIKITDGQFYGYNEGALAAYINTYHKYENVRSMRIGSVGGLVIATPHIAVYPAYAGVGASLTVHEGGTGTLKYISKITQNSNGTITWTESSLAFYNGIMCTAL